MLPEQQEEVLLYLLRRPWPMRSAILPRRNSVLRRWKDDSVLLRNLLALVEGGGHHVGTGAVFRTRIDQ
jgi:hypothetical protein